MYIDSKLKSFAMQASCMETTSSVNSFRNELWQANRA